MSSLANGTAEGRGRGELMETQSHLTLNIVGMLSARLIHKEIHLECNFIVHKRVSLQASGIVLQGRFDLIYLLCFEPGQDPPDISRKSPEE